MHKTSIHTYIHTYIHAYLWFRRAVSTECIKQAYIHTYINTYMHACIPMVPKNLLSVSTECMKHVMNRSIRHSDVPTASITSCMYVCTYVYMYICIYVCMYIGVYVWVYVCMHVCVCMYGCVIIRVFTYETNVCVGVTITKACAATTCVALPHSLPCFCVRLYAYMHMTHIQEHV
jgi:hypothetical protein